MLPQTMVALAPIDTLSLHLGCSEFVFALNSSSRVVDISKDARGATEYAVFKCYTLVQTNIILNFAIVSNRDVGANHYVLTNVAIFADYCSA